MQKMTQRDVLITKNHVLARRKINFLDRNFSSSRIEVKKIFLNCKIELAKNAKYDSASCLDHEKLCFSPSKNQF